MNRKILSAAAVLGAAVLALSACGTQQPVSVDPSQGGAETSIEVQVAAETFDVGNFTVDLPAGWKAFPQSDVFGEKDAAGNYPTDPSLIYVAKDAASDIDLFTKPYLNIHFSDMNTSDLSAKSWYEDIEDFDMEIQGVACDEAFAGTSTISDTYRYECLHVILENGQFSVSYPIEIDGTATGLSHEDPEVIAIIESLTVK